MGFPTDGQAPLTGIANPFAHNVLMVAIIRQRVAHGGVPVKVPDSQCQRVFFRVGNQRQFPRPMGATPELMPTGTAKDKLYGFNNLIPYTPLVEP